MEELPQLTTRTIMSLGVSAVEGCSSWRQSGKGRGGLDQAIASTTTVVAMMSSTDASPPENTMFVAETAGTEDAPPPA